MDYKDYIKDGKLILPEGFNSPLNCYYNNLKELILPKGFNSYLNCKNNQLKKIVLPEGFNSDLYCHGNNNLEELILPEGYNNRYFHCDETVKVYKWNEWLSIQRERKINAILDEL